MHDGEQQSGGPEDVPEPPERVTEVTYEEVDAVLVPAGERVPTSQRAPGPAAARTAAAAAGGFIAGAATLALLHRRDAKRLARALQRPELRPGQPLFPASGTRRYIVDVHVVSDRRP